MQSAAFYSLPGDLVRYEIRLSGPVGLSYYTGLWSVPDFEVVEEEVTSSSNPLFRDVTAHVFGRTESFSEQLLKGNPFWRARLDAATGIDVYGNQGIAVGDIDNDGADEIYVCQPGGLPNRLYRFRPDGTAADITEQAGVGVLDETTCALFIDLRNSGHQDLIVLRSSGPLFFLKSRRRDFPGTSGCVPVQNASRRVLSPEWRRRIMIATAAWICTSAVMSTSKAKINISSPPPITMRRTARRIFCSESIDDRWWLL